MQEKNIVIF